MHIRRISRRLAGPQVECGPVGCPIPVRSYPFSIRSVGIDKLLLAALKSPAKYALIHRRNKYELL